MSNEKSLKIVSGMVTVKLKTKQAATVLINMLEESIEDQCNRFPMVRDWYASLPEGTKINTSYELAVYPKYLDVPKQSDDWLGSKLKELAANFIRRSEQEPDEWWLVIREDAKFEPRHIGTMLAQYMGDYPETLVNPDFLAFTSVCMSSVGTEVIPPYGLTTVVKPFFTITFSDATVAEMNQEQFIEHLEAQKEIVNISRSLAWVPDTISI